MQIGYGLIAFNSDDADVLCGFFPCTDAEKLSLISEEEEKNMGMMDTYIIDNVMKCVHETRVRERYCPRYCKRGPSC